VVDFEGPDWQGDLLARQHRERLKRIERVASSIAATARYAGVKTSLGTVRTPWRKVDRQLAELQQLVVEAENHERELARRQERRPPRPVHDEPFRLQQPRRPRGRLWPTFDEPMKDRPRGWT
jgi:hypothetical protein